VIDLFEKCRSDGGYFGALRSRRDRYFTQPVLEERPGPHMKFEGRDVVMWAINDYLGLAGRRGALRPRRAHGIANAHGQYGTPHRA
jgi:7-keto-8-aminopelargonate synthetase-like enzyme